MTDNITVMEQRVTDAINGDLEWNVLCDEPKKTVGFDKLWHIDTKKKALEKSVEEKFYGVENKLMESMYYSIYVILLWKHERGFERYGQSVETFINFKLKYINDVMLVNHKLYEFSWMSDAEWWIFYCYRNITILASAISPKKASQKCIFMKIVGNLVEDKIHATGSKQSHAAARIAHIYDKEGATFNLRKLNSNNNSNSTSNSSSNKRTLSEISENNEDHDTNMHTADTPTTIQPNSNSNINSNSNSNPNPVDGNDVSIC